MKKNVYIVFVLILAVFVLSGCGQKGTVTPAEETIKIIAAHNQTAPENPYQIGMLKFKEVAEAKSKGSIEVEVHAGTLGTEESELVEKLKLGAADVVLASPGFMTQTGINEVDLFALPYLFDSYEHWMNVVDGEVGEEFKKLIKEKSNNEFQVIGYWSAGVRHYYGKKPINSISDLKGMSIRTQTSGVVADFWIKVGAVPASVAWGELYQALQQKVVDSAENAYPYFVQQNHHKTENGKYITETGHDYTTRLLMINGKKFESLTAEQKEIILEAAKACVDTERESLLAQEDEYKEKATAEGAIVNEIDRAPFIEIAEPIQEKLAKEIGAEDLLQKIKELK